MRKEKYQRLEEELEKMRKIKSNRVIPLTLGTVKILSLSSRPLMENSRLKKIMTTHREWEKSVFFQNLETKNYCINQLSRSSFWDRPIKNSLSKYFDSSEKITVLSLSVNFLKIDQTYTIISVYFSKSEIIYIQISVLFILWNKK